MSIEFHGKSTDAVGSSLGYVGMLLALAMFLSPVPTMKRVLAERSIRDFSEIPYATSVCNCILWVAYGIATPGRLFPMLTNMCGLFLSSIYCAIFLHFSAGEAFNRVRRRVCGVLISMGIVVSISFVLPALDCPGFLGNGDSSTTDLLGLVAAAFNTGMYASPLSAMATVLKTRSVEFMPLPLTLGTLGCCVAWALYAFYVGDVFIGIPNYLGICLSVAQVALYVAYCNRGSNDVLAIRGSADFLTPNVPNMYESLLDDAESGSENQKCVASPRNVRDGDLHTAEKPTTPIPIEENTEEHDSPLD